MNDFRKSIVISLSDYPESTVVRGFVEFYPHPITNSEGKIHRIVQAGVTFHEPSSDDGERITPAQSFTVYGVDRIADLRNFLDRCIEMMNPLKVESAAE